MKVTIPLKIIELEEGNCHLFAACKFENGETGYWAIDTGASKTIFNRSLTEQYFFDSDPDPKGVQSAGIGETLFETYPGTMLPFTFGNLLIENLNVALLDLSHINKLYHQAAELNICGLIGGDFLHKHQAIIDYRKKVLMLTSTGKKRFSFK